MGGCFTGCLLTLSLIQLVVAPAPFYTRQIYNHRQSLAPAAEPTLHTTPRRLRTEQLEVPVLVQALNFRLPVIPTSRPTLRDNINKNITTFKGAVVVLPCRVVHLGSASVSWIRRPQLTVLTYGVILFSSSPRLKLLHEEDSPDWNLQIQSALPEDSGTYECQINTEPKISRVVHLVVTDEESLTQPVLPGQPMQVAGSTLALLDAPALAMQAERFAQQRVQKTEILSPPEISIEEGGSVTMECVVTEHQVPPTSFTWYIGQKALDFHVHRGGILLQEERKTRSSASKLTITRMSVEESAVYTCSPHGADSASVRVTVYAKQNNEYGDANCGEGLPVYFSLYLAILLFTTANLSS